MYKFSLKFDDDKHTLNSKVGIPIDKLASLLEDLYNAIDLDKEANCTLSNIRGNCYALDFNSVEESHLTQFKIVHKNIKELPINVLEPNQRKYAKTLRKILGNNLYAVAYDENDKKIVSIKEFSSIKDIKFYHTYQTIYGYISELGARSVTSKNKHIKVDGFPFNIYIGEDLDLKLKPYYRTDKLSMKIKLKRVFEKGSVVNAEMVDFRVVEKTTLSENLRSIGYVDLNVLKDVKTIDGLIESIYGGN